MHLIMHTQVLFTWASVLHVFSQIHGYCVRRDNEKRILNFNIQIIKLLYKASIFRKPYLATKQTDILLKAKCRKLNFN